MFCTMPAADTLQLLMTDIDGNDVFADVTVSLNNIVNKVRRLSNILEQYNNNTFASGNRLQRGTVQVAHIMLSGRAN